MCHGKGKYTVLYFDHLEYSSFVNRTERFCLLSGQVNSCKALSSRAHSTWEKGKKCKHGFIEEQGHNQQDNRSHMSNLTSMLTVIVSTDPQITSTILFSGIKGKCFPQIKPFWISAGFLWVLHFSPTVWKHTSLVGVDRGVGLSSLVWINLNNVWRAP